MCCTTCGRLKQRKRPVGNSQRLSKVVRALTDAKIGRLWELLMVVVTKAWSLTRVVATRASTVMWIKVFLKNLTCCIFLWFVWKRWQKGWRGVQLAQWMKRLQSLLGGSCSWYSLILSAGKFHRPFWAVSHFGTLHWRVRPLSRNSPKMASKSLPEASRSLPEAGNKQQVRFN